MLQQNDGSKGRKADGDLDPDDEFGDYFEQSLMLEADTLGILDPATLQPDVYEEALRKVHREIEKANRNEEQINTSTKPGALKAREEDDFGDELMEQMMSADTNSYVCEYNDVVAQISSICSLIVKNPKGLAAGTPFEIEDEVVSLCPRIYELATEYKNQPSEVKQKCFMETLLKGSFSLLAIKSPHVAF